MNVIGYFGDILSEKINIPPIAARGLIRFTLKDEFGSSDNPTYQNLLLAFKNNLKTRLERIGIENQDSILDEMIIELKKKQSLFTMSSV